jgi:hypothetical protein
LLGTYWGSHGLTARRSASVVFVLTAQLDG